MNDDRPFNVAPIAIPFIVLIGFIVVAALYDVALNAVAWLS